MRRLLLMAVTGASLAGALAACDVGFPAGREPHHEFNFLDMADQPKVKPQRATPRRVLPPVGAVAIDHYPHPYRADQGELAGRQVGNPLKNTASNVAYGKWVFENVCIVCHGPQAAGDGEVSKLFPQPPSLMTQKIRDWTDGRIFHVPMRGQGSMPSYAKQLEPEELWAVVLYLRRLQSELPVAPKDPSRASASDAPADAPGGTGGAGGAAGQGGTGPGGSGGGGGAAGASGAAGGAGGSGGAGPADDEARPDGEPAATAEPGADGAPDAPAPDRPPQPAKPPEPAKPPKPAAPPAPPPEDYP